MNDKCGMMNVHHSAFITQRFLQRFFIYRSSSVSTVVLSDPMRGSGQ